MWGIYGQIAHLTYHTIAHNAPKMKRSAFMSWTPEKKTKFCNFYSMCLGHQWFCQIAPFFKCKKWFHGIFCTFLDFSKIATYCVWSNEWVVFCCCQRDFEIFLTATTVKWLNCWGGGGKKCRATTYIQGRNYFFSTLFRVNFLEFLSQKIRCCWVLVLNEAFP